tara:strand:+ start:3552 stop:4754 length:1203 start_codon:yes stop_codon:yes gene_type:complete
MKSKCICDGTNLIECINLGSIPLVNNFKKVYQPKKYPLSMGICKKCMLFQIQKNIKPELLFSNYAHISAGSKSNINHIKKVFKKICQIKKIDKKTKILEIGCNDGTLLKIAKKKTNNIIGVDPAKNLMSKIKTSYLELIPDFFNKNNGEYLKSKYKKFDVIIALNVIPHTINVKEILQYVGKLLADDGIFFMEGAYFFDTIYKGKFDTIYHEHVSSFTLHSLKNLLTKSKMKIHVAERIPTQGGSIRLIAKKKTKSSQWRRIYRDERLKKVDKISTYKKTGKLIEKIIFNINKDFKKLTSKNKAVLLGAPARGVVISHVCNIDNRKIEFAIDDSETKHNTFFPGKKIKVYNWDKLKKSKCGNFLALSWNYKDDLLKKLKKYRNKFNFMTPFPKSKISKFF